MGKNFDLVDRLQNYLRGMTPAELMAFRRELAEGLPGFLEETAKKARQSTPKARRPSRKPSGDKSIRDNEVKEFRDAKHARVHGKFC